MVERKSSGCDSKNRGINPMTRKTIFKGWCCPSEFCHKRISAILVTEKVMGNYCKSCYGKCMPLLVTIERAK